MKKEIIDATLFSFWVIFLISWATVTFLMLGNVITVPIWAKYVFGIFLLISTTWTCIICFYKWRKSRNGTSVQEVIFD